MLLFLVLLIVLSPLSAFAQVQLPTRPPTHEAPQGWNVIPNGQGGVTYVPGQGGTDAYTAGIIGQGLTRQFQHTSPPPRYESPPLRAPDIYYRHDNPVTDANREFLEYLNRR